ncbi:MAG: homocysteine S-methyltransferase family protein [Candidatus Bipolaricaulota bacterium]
MVNLKEYLCDLSRLAVFDGAIGTELARRKGNWVGQFGEQLNLQDPDAVKAIHRSYLRGGADFLTTNTFSANGIQLAKDGLGDEVESLNRTGAELAREAASDKPGVLVAGSIGPTGQGIVPVGSLTVKDAYEAFLQQAKALHRGGVDLLVIETMGSIQEAKAAAYAAREVGLEFIPSMSFSAGGTTHYGTSPSVMAVTFAALGAGAISANCGSGPEPYLNVVEEYRSHVSEPIMIEPNAGDPLPGGDHPTYDLNPERFLDILSPTLSKLSLLGSCCGSTPDFTKAIASISDRYPGYQGPTTSETEKLLGFRDQIYSTDRHFVPVEPDQLLKNFPTQAQGYSDVPLLDLRSSSEPAGGWEKKISTLVLRFRANLPLGFYLGDSDLLALCLKLYPGFPPVKYEGPTEEAEEACSRYGGFLLPS